MKLVKRLCTEEDGQGLGRVYVCRSIGGVGFLAGS